MFEPRDAAEGRAELRGFIVGEGFSPHDARSLRITQDGRGLEYGAEKTYDMVAGVNFIIANGRHRIPGFGLKGSLFASTEFEPHLWLVRIGEDGWAHQEPCRLQQLWSHDKGEYLRRFRLQMYWKAMGPIYEAAQRHGGTSTGGTDHKFREAMEALCYRYVAFRKRREMAHRRRYLKRKGLD